MKAQTIFEPGVTERYLDTGELGERWKCHIRTVSVRAEKLGVPILLIGGSVRFPLSEILKIEQAAVAHYQNRKTEFPSQFTKAPAKPAAWSVQGAAPWQGDRSKGHREMIAMNSRTQLTLSLEESARLRNCKTVIEAGLQTFVEVGNALSEIRDSKLYRQTHSTFEAYCRGKIL